MNPQAPTGPAQPCGALLPPIRPAGWHCNGTHLVALTTGTGPLTAAGVPVVVREDLLSAIDEPTRSIVTGTIPFTGGNHCHLGLEGTPMPDPAAADTMRGHFLELNERVKPFHEWLDGQRAHFTGQGYTDDEARAMAAAEFVTIFSTGINRG